MAKKKIDNRKISASQFQLLLQSMTVANIKELIKYYNDKYIGNGSKNEKLKGFSALKKESLIEFVASHFNEKEKRETYKKFEPEITKTKVENALSLISGEHKVEKIQQASLIPGGKGYKIGFKGKYGVHKTSVEVLKDSIKRTCDCRFSQLGGICIHQTAIFLMLISKKVIPLTKMPFKVEKKWFESIQKRLDLIASQSLFKEEPAIMLSNDYKIYVNGDFVTYEWTGNFPGKKTIDLSKDEVDVDTWISNKVVEIMLKHIKVKTKEGTPERIVIDSFNIIQKIMERPKLVKKILRKFTALEDSSLPAEENLLEAYLKKDLKETVSEMVIEPPFKAYNGKKPFLFVSYTHKDKKDVYPIIKNLNKNGINIWYDEGIPLTTDWGDVLGEQIIDCSLFLSFISPHVNESENTKKEIKYASLKKRPCISIHLSETELSPGIEMILQDVQGIMKHKMEEKQFNEKLVSEI
ncbi:MAG: toll/interleukin-1 receptor domain-containing protein, partial [archaeon]|nr:toll/interleukin-1 receptor domain-containing protein [archaeon]